MAKFKERLSDEFDIHVPFEDSSSQVYVRNARGAIERLRDEGRGHFGDESREYKRWEKACNELWSLVLSLHSDKAIRDRQKNTKNEGEDATVLIVFRDFIKLFEHAQFRLHQLAFAGKSNNPFISQTFYWLNLYYRYATYAIISVYLGDKTEETPVCIKINLSTRERSEKWTKGPPIKTPQKCRQKT